MKSEKVRTAEAGKQVKIRASVKKISSYTSPLPKKAISYQSNLLSASFGGGLNLISSDYSCFGLNPLGVVIMLPQILGNFKIHLPIIKDHIHLYIGEATDYYLYPAESTVYTESKAGIKLAFFRFAAECFISKPWLKGYQDSDKPYNGFHVGTYVNRKTIEKGKKEHPEENIR
jgi:hypothetical protein